MWFSTSSLMLSVVMKIAGISNNYPWGLIWDWGLDLFGLKQKVLRVNKLRSISHSYRFKNDKLIKSNNIQRFLIKGVTDRCLMQTFWHFHNKQ